MTGKAAGPLLPSRSHRRERMIHCWAATASHCWNTFCSGETLGKCCAPARSVSCHRGGYLRGQDCPGSSLMPGRRTAEAVHCRSRRGRSHGFIDASVSIAQRSSSAIIAAWRQFFRPAPRIIQYPETGGITGDRASPHWFVRAARTTGDKPRDKNHRQQGHGDCGVSP